MQIHTAPPKIGFVSLGCPKATVDSEHIITQLRAEGYETAQDYKEANLIIVNTCGFIDEAVQESLDAINEALDENGKVIVTGCLGARKEKDGKDFITAKFPNILAVTGPDSLAEVMDAVHKHLPRPREPFFDLLPPQGIKLTPRHYAYLKISEGCNHSCTFCIIPSLRGKLVSYQIGDIMQNAKKLLDGGVKELLLISQDTGAYGIDSKTRTAFWGGKPLKTNIASLVDALGNLAQPYGAWIRLHYVYPYKHIDRVIPLMASGKILPYLDVPFQHAHPDTLRRMQRPANAEKNLERIQGWREICPDITIRSTFITGFPGETEDEFEYLLNFIREAKIDRLGCFSYSSVEGARANDLPNQIPQELREERRERLMMLQAEISNELLKSKIGKTMQVIVDETLSAGKAIGRTSADAPDIDGIVNITRPKRSRKKINAGEFINVHITQSDDHDLYGEWIPD